MFCQAIDQEDCRDHHQNEADHQPSEPVDALVEGGQHAPPSDLVGKLPKKRFRASPQNHAGAEA